MNILLYAYSKALIKADEHKHTNRRLRDMKIKQRNNHTRIGSLELPKEIKLRSLDPGIINLLLEIFSRGLVLYKHLKLLN